MTLSSKFGVVLASMLMCSSVFAQSGEAPPTIDGAKTVTAEEVKPLLGQAVILDARKKAAWLEGHIPGAKSIAEFRDEKARIFAPAAFPENKAAVVVIYGHGPDGWAAVDAVKSAVASGNKDVRWLREGLGGWTTKKMPVE